MNVHKNARLTRHSRADLVQRVRVEGQTAKAVATAFGVAIKTVGKWGLASRWKPPTSGRTPRSFWPRPMGKSAKTRSSPEDDRGKTEIRLQRRHRIPSQRR